MLGRTQPGNRCESRAGGPAHGATRAQAPISWAFGVQVSCTKELRVKEAQKRVKAQKGSETIKRGSKGVRDGHRGSERVREAQTEGQRGSETVKIKGQRSRKGQKQSKRVKKLSKKCQKTVKKWPETLKKVKEWSKRRRKGRSTPQEGQRGSKRGRKMQSGRSLTQGIVALYSRARSCEASSAAGSFGSMTHLSLPQQRVSKSTGGRKRVLMVVSRLSSCHKSG